MTTDYNNLNPAVLSDVKTKLKSVNYEYLIDRYFTSQNIIITTSIIFFFVVLVVVIVTFRSSSDTLIDVNEFSIEKLEKNMALFNDKQDSIQISLIEIIESIEKIKKQAGIVNKKSETKSILPDIPFDDIDFNVDANNLSSNTENLVLSNDDSGDSSVIIRNKNNKIEGGGSKDVNLKKLNLSKIESDFNIEDVDKRWKNKVEVEILTSLEDERFKKTWFDKLECRSNTCKLEINHYKKKFSDSFKNDFSKGLSDIEIASSTINYEDGIYKSVLFIRNKTPIIENEIDPEVVKIKDKKDNIKVKSAKKLKIEDVFKKEKIDNRWRKLIEFKIMTVLNNKKFRKTWFDSLLCKSSSCKLVTTHSKKSTSKKFAKEFPALLGDFEDKKVKTKKSHNGNFKTTMYLQQRI